MSEVVLPTTIAFGATASSVKVNRVNVKQDGSGDWQIGVQMETETPDRVDVPGIRLNENHRAGAQITVTRAEIAAGAGISEDEVRTSLTLEQTETIVTTIATGKLLAVFGISV